VQAVDGQNVATERRPDSLVPDVRRELEPERLQDLRDPVDARIAFEHRIELLGVDAAEVADQLVRPDVVGGQLFDGEQLPGIGFLLNSISAKNVLDTFSSSNC
jgi:hypothetical protein